MQNSKSWKHTKQLGLYSSLAISTLEYCFYYHSRLTVYYSKLTNVAHISCTTENIEKPYVCTPLPIVQTRSVVARFLAVAISRPGTGGQNLVNNNKGVCSVVTKLVIADREILALKGGLKNSHQGQVLCPSATNLEVTYNSLPPFLSMLKLPVGLNRQFPPKIYNDKRHGEIVREKEH